MQPYAGAACTIVLRTKSSDTVQYEGPVQKKNVSKGAHALFHCTTVQTQHTNRSRQTCLCVQACFLPQASPSEWKFQKWQAQARFAMLVPEEEPSVYRSACIIHGTSGLQNMTVAYVQQLLVMCQLTGTHTAAGSMCQGMCFRTLGGHHRVMNSM